jgi:hypothetical protein
VGRFESGADVGYEDAQMGAPLVVAISMKRGHLAKRLLAAGAGVKKQEAIPSSAMEIALHEMHDPAGRWL